MTYINFKDLVEKFATENLEYTDDCMDYIKISNLYDIFNAWCKQNHLRNCTRRQWTLLMRKNQRLAYDKIRVPKRLDPNLTVMRVFKYVKVRNLQ